MSDNFLEIQNVTFAASKKNKVNNVTFNLEKEGEIICLLGPSGIGKTTMLRTIAGLEKIESGKIILNGKTISSPDFHMEPEKRNIAQVFQFPVIYNTMSVYSNLAFPLKCRNFNENIIKSKVIEVAEILNLNLLLDKAAKELTADQKQLISLGRGLVREDVAAILMDEPLTVIDPDLKFRLRRKLKEINEKYNTTLIYVTHDQNEAMTFANKIIVMDSGNIVQAGNPKELFERPQTTFVGYFIGSPAMNIYDCTALSDFNVSIGDIKLKTSTNLSNVKSEQLKIGIRSEFIKLVNDKSDNIIEAKIENVEDFGNYKLITVNKNDLTIKAKVERDAEIPHDTVLLNIPAERCCIYQNNYLI